MLVFDNRLVNEQDGSTILLQSHLLLELVDNWFIKIMYMRKNSGVAVGYLNVSAER